MPDYAYLQTELRCPGCGTPVTDRIWFQWGYCPGYGPRAGSMYAVGDVIRWRAAPDGSIPVWTYFRDGGEHGGSNQGDPAVPDLVVRDHAQVWLEEACPRCGIRWGGAAVEIRGGTILRGWLTREGELGRDADVFVTEPGGRLTPQPQWNDAPMRILDLPER